jgi:cysteine desulfurase
MAQEAGMQRSVYLDYAATTPVDRRVIDAMIPCWADNWGNPNSLYSIGRRAFTELEDARARVAEQVGASRPDEIIFTGGGTESDNSAIFGIAQAARDRTGRDHVVTSSIEHKAVLEAVEAIGKRGFNTTTVDPRADGRVHPEDVAKVLTDKTALVSIMHINNEIGTIQPLAEISRVVHEAGALLHSDAVQSLGKIPFDAQELGLDAASFSAHKIYGPKGVGVLYLKKGTPYAPVIIGGGQENKRRSGTQNLAGAVGFATAAEIANETLDEEMERLRALRDRLIDGLLAIPNTELNGDRVVVAPHIANMIIKGVEGEAMLLQLDAAGVSVSTGSACSSGSLAPSHVLLAIGRPPELAHGSLRLSLGRFTTDEDIEYFLEVFPPIVEKLRAMSPVYEKMFGSTA